MSVANDNEDLVARAADEIRSAYSFGVAMVAGVSAVWTDVNGAGFMRRVIARLQENAGK